MHLMLFEMHRLLHILSPRVSGGAIYLFQRKKNNQEKKTMHFESGKEGTTRAASAAGVLREGMMGRRGESSAGVK